MYAWYVKNWYQTQYMVMFIGNNSNCKRKSTDDCQWTDSFTWSRLTVCRPHFSKRNRSTPKDQLHITGFYTSLIIWRPSTLCHTLPMQYTNEKLSNHHLHVITLSTINHHSRPQNYNRQFIKLKWSGLLYFGVNVALVVSVSWCLN